MKQNSFDVPAYKFALAVPNRNRGIYDTNKSDAIKSCIDTGDFTLVPFENVDGLTIKEVVELIKKEDFALICYGEYFNINSTININVFFTLVFLAEFLKLEEEKQIDELVTSQLESCYNKSTNIQQRIFDCFFTRYQDVNYEATLERKRKLVAKDNNKML